MIKRDQKSHGLLIISALMVFIIILSATSVWAQEEREKVDSGDPKPNRPVPGSLAIVSDPPGAKVLLNNRLLGTTAADGTLNKQLKPGRYTVVVNYPEYKPYIQTITVKAEGGTVYAKLVPTFGFLVLNANELKPDAELKLDGSPLLEEKFSREPDNTLKIRTSPGEHEIKISQAGYIPFSKKVTVTVSEPASVLVVLEPELATLIVKSEPKARVYIAGEPKGEIPETGQVEYPELNANQSYKVMVVLDGYEKREETVAVKYGVENVFEAKLTPLPTSGEFSDGFLDLSQWDTPGGWKAQKRTLLVQGAGIGMPKNLRYRDCQVSFVLRLLKSRGAAWVVRAKDAKNYYLFYLGGPTAQFPNQLRAYICNNGEIDLNKPAGSPQPVDIDLKAGVDYEMRIKITNNAIEHFITPSNTGKEVQIGVYKDLKNSFTIGNVGFAVVDGEEFLVSQFYIKPNDNVAADKSR